MHNLTLEWIKFRKNSTFQIICFLYLVLLPLLILAIRSMDVSIPGLSSDLLVQYPTVWSFLAYSGSWLAYFLWGFLGIYLISSEFSQKTFRQNIISGLTRAQLFFGKVQFLVVIALLSTLYFTIWATIFGILNQPPDNDYKIWERIDMIPRYFLMTLGYMSLGVFTAILIRKTALSVFLYFAYTLFLEPTVRWLIHRQIADNRSMHFYPANAFEDLTPIPLGDVSITKGLVESGEMNFYLTGQEAIVTSIIYIILLFTVSFYLVKTRDL